MSGKQRARTKEPEAKPKRVPLAEVPGKSWKIKRMPEDLKAAARPVAQRRHVS